MYLSSATVQQAITALRGTANHLLKIWFVLKAMGMTESNPVFIDTGNSTPYLKKLFSCGAPDGKFYVPFSHTKRFAFMQSDASRSIIQTTIQRWVTSASVVTCDPRGYLEITNTESGQLRIQPGRRYPLGLGYGQDGFALRDGERTTVPDVGFAIWYYARAELPESSSADLVAKMCDELHISHAELETVFVHKDIPLVFTDSPVSDSDLYRMCNRAFEGDVPIEDAHEEQAAYIRRVQKMATITDQPRWLQIDPAEQLATAINSGEHSVLLYGPPRTGKTRAIDQIVARNDPARETVQMHEGWGYENLIGGLFPSEDPGKYEWRDGILTSAVNQGKKHIVIEEINRTRISQALGEVFSLIESAYRGEENAIILPNGKQFWIPDDVNFYFTMNTIDSSTEDVDDALIGRMAAVFFPPRIEDLDSILCSNGVVGSVADQIKDIFNLIQKEYPLGHGYFAGYKPTLDFKAYYTFRIRPVLSNHFDSFQPEVLNQIDNAVDSTFMAEE